MKKITLIGAVALALAAGTVFLEQGAFPLPTSASPAISFQDVPSDYWAKDAIQTAVDNGYVIGKTEGIFDPEASVTRAEFIKMVVTAEKLPVSGETTGKDWYGPYVNAAVLNGIHAWSDFTYGDWNTPLTRAEMARLAVRGTGTDNTDDKKWLYLATKAGLIQGMDNTGTLAEDGTTTRAQSVTIIERILSVKRGEKLPSDKHAVNRAELLWHKTNIFTVMPAFVSRPYEAGTTWNPDNLTLITKDGLWSGTLEQLIAIDLDDPNDPHRNLLPIDQLKWFNLQSVRTSYKVTDYPHSYLLYYPGHINFNYDSSKYGNSRTFPSIDFAGVGNNDLQSFVNGNLNDIASVFVNKLGDIPAFIIPKKIDSSEGEFGIRMYSPARVPNPTEYNPLLSSKVTKGTVDATQY